ncbi:MAG: methylated-DNA--[protein]-cysteine S-methyltransferase [Gemmatimonas sp.]|nr:methylated-DNA--[protein]-cysteine S-methyltransferase [Gemmatimonas sp.]
MPEPTFSERVYATVRRIPYGRVVTYGGIAALLGTPRAARGVGSALAALPEGNDVPWWRVVNGRGEISLPHYPGRLQRMLLEQEGVPFRRSGTIDLRRFGWRTQFWEEDRSDVGGRRPAREGGETNR